MCLFRAKNVILAHCFSLGVTRLVNVDGCCFANKIATVEQTRQILGLKGLFIFNGGIQPMGLRAGGDMATDYLVKGPISDIGSLLVIG
jgi:hypothetical protein